MLKSRGRPSLQDVIATTPEPINFLEIATGTPKLSPPLFDYLLCNHREILRLHNMVAVCFSEH